MTKGWPGNSPIGDGNVHLVGIIGTSGAVGAQAGQEDFLLFPQLTPSFILIRCRVLFVKTFPSTSCT